MLKLVIERLNLILRDNMKDKLKKYFQKEEIEKLFEGLESNQRANILNEKYFAKIGKNTNKLFYTNLVKEINFYNQNKGNKNLPNIIDSYIDGEYCLIVLDKIKGQVLGTTRNEFDLKLSEETRLDISKSVLNIKNINVTFSLDKDYNRKEKLDKYFEKSLKYLEVNTINKIKDIYEDIIKDDSNYVLSHGDLICPNIMICDNKILFIDWEFISLKPEYYDLAYFLLFSKENNSLDIIKNFKFNINTKELYKDGIIICLKEIQNWIKLFGTVEEDIVNKKINRWKQELNNILEIYSK